MTLKLYGNGNIENVDSIVTSASATLSATELGYIDGVTSALQTQLNNAGKILQVVRATDGTRRDTTSGSFTDASISVTITPTKSTSAVLLIWTGMFANLGASSSGELQITDSSNNGIDGAQRCSQGYANEGDYSLFGYSTPATTSAITYKGRFRTTSADTFRLYNDIATGQLFAIEVAA